MRQEENEGVWDEEVDEAEENSLTVVVLRNNEPTHHVAEAVLGDNKALLSGFVVNGLWYLRVSSEYVYVYEDTYRQQVRNQYPFDQVDWRYVIIPSHIRGSSNSIFNWVHEQLISGTIEVHQLQATVEPQTETAVEPKSPTEDEMKEALRSLSNDVQRVIFNNPFNVICLLYQLECSNFARDIRNNLVPSSDAALDRLIDLAHHYRGGKLPRTELTELLKREHNLQEKG